MNRRAFSAALAAAPLAFAQPVGPRPIIFDTDIGADVDDALALIYLLNSPEIDLRGVTTVMRNTRRRAQYARQVLDVMGRGSRIPCCAGCQVPLTPGARPRPLRGYSDWVLSQPMAGYGDDGELGKSQNPPISATHAVDFIIESTRRPGGPRHLLVVGAQTNAAMALLKDPSLADRLDGITLMGYYFRTGLDPYNVGGDIAAARHVLASGVPLRVVPTEIGLACQMTEAEYRNCQASQCPHMRFVNVFMRRWVEYVRARPGSPVPDYLPRPYDSLAAASLTHPHLFEWRRGTIELTPQDDPKKPNTRFTEHSDGIHEIAAGVDRERAMALHQQRLLACAAPPAR